MAFPRSIVSLVLLLQLVAAHRTPEEIFSSILGKTFCRHDENSLFETVAVSFTGYYQPHNPQVKAEFNIVVASRHFHAAQVQVATDDEGELYFDPHKFGDLFSFIKKALMRKGLHETDKPTLTAGVDHFTWVFDNYGEINIMNSEATTADYDENVDWLKGCPT
ncbi:hypothetical protein FOL47_005930 [Perkinsus chesapeaki]|uniref:Uncharacterized protein n=1 Tax=Perkinsus chesapeaki TaxID=330153 RepID=A0A7J6LUY2_PERCH|nr:hypothetical protein FOL47_005930 [Perkinsus chesapeaki]